MRRTSQEPAIKSTEGVRSFIALPLGADAVHVLAHFCTEASTKVGSAWRFVAVSNLHVTLRFLGAIPESLVPDVLEVCKVSANTIPPPHLRLQGIGAFPGWHRPSVLWAGLAGNVPLLHTLANRLNRELEKIGFPSDGKAFQPHITLARCKNSVVGAASADAWRNLSNALQAEWTTQEIFLYQSILHPQGPEYTVLGRARLTSANVTEGE